MAVSGFLNCWQLLYLGLSSMLDAGLPGHALHTAAATKTTRSEVL
jgi:hypothetical protein